MLLLILFLTFTSVVVSEENPKVCLENITLCYTGSYRVTQSGKDYASFQGKLSCSSKID